MEMSHKNLLPLKNQPLSPASPAHPPRVGSRVGTLPTNPASNNTQPEPLWKGDHRVQAASFTGGVRLCTLNSLLDRQADGLFPKLSVTNHMHFTL